MKTLLLTGLLTLSLLSAALAQTVLEENFDQPADESLWQANGRVDYRDGKLVLSAGTEDEVRSGSSGLRAPQFPPAFNFTKKPVAIQLDGLNVGGTGQVTSHVFILCLTSNEAVAEPDAEGYVKLRLDGEGQLLFSSLWIKDSGEREERPVVKMHVSLPISKALITLDETGVEIDLEDASGSHQQRADWGEYLNKEKWQDAQPSLIVKNNHIESMGVSEVTLDALKFEVRP